MACNRKEQTSSKMNSSAVCNVCRKTIEGRIVTALDKQWHPEHFACVECKRPIDGTFHEKDGKVYCLNDYMKKHGSTCRACGQPIQDKIIKALDACWHEEHFVCQSCKIPLAGTKFMEQSGNPYCNTCYSNKFASRCHGCAKPIENKSVIAFDKKWHQECFKCGNCSKPVTESSFAVSNGKPLCSKCSK